jgi:formyltetrahydrofolate deformylase
MSVEQPSQGFILTLDCASGPGQVAAASGFLDAHGCYIDELAVFDDDISSRFFVRCMFHGPAERHTSIEALRQAFMPVAQRFAMSWAMHDRAERARVLIMVSKFDHCLNDLLYRWRIGELAMDVAAVVSNHLDLEPIARAHELPFHHLPVTPQTKAAQEGRLMDIVSATGAEFVVLARYMQVLSADLCEKLAGRAINIHHSFLPGFKGARPYTQAHERGVKLIGATAHFVTSDLDEGPIIEQVVERVDHACRPEQLAATGRDTECAALARAVKYCVERRVFLNGRRTVVFR